MIKYLLDTNICIDVIKRRPIEVLDYDEHAASHYGEIRADLERKGKTIGVNDLHISGHARSLSVILVSNNLKEFERVDGLRCQNWVDGF